MDKFLLKLLKPLIIKKVLKYLEDEDNKKELVALANKKLDLPKMDEVEEQKLFEKLYLAISEALVSVVKKI